MSPGLSYPLHPAPPPAPSSRCGVAPWSPPGPDPGVPPSLPALTLTCRVCPDPLVTSVLPAGSWLRPHLLPRGPSASSWASSLPPRGPRGVFLYPGPTRPTPAHSPILGQVQPSSCCWRPCGQWACQDLPLSLITSSDRYWRNCLPQHSRSPWGLFLILEWPLPPFLLAPWRAIPSAS